MATASAEKAVIPTPCDKRFFWATSSTGVRRKNEVLGIVRKMIESSAAFAVMGNHEYNAIAYATRDSQTGDFLRPHSERNERQHKAFVDAYTGRPQEYKATIGFKALPPWLGLGGIRLVNA